MAAQLEIQDGSLHWYYSPDIWTVPGSDPNGMSGTPIVGQTAYVWARVTNKGSTAIEQARVDFWWANPSGQVLRSNANKIGSAFVDLAPSGQPGDVQEVLCLSPWNVVLVNGGHECLVAVVDYPGSSVPNPPPDAFDPTNHLEVAQKNLDVFVAKIGILVQLITIAAPARADKFVVIETEVGGRLDDLSLERLGLKGHKPARNPKVEVGLGQQPISIAERASLGDERLKLEVSRGTLSGVYVAIRAKGLERNEYALVNVIERQGDRIIGGYGFVVVSEAQEQRK